MSKRNVGLAFALIASLGAGFGIATAGEPTGKPAAPATTKPVAKAEVNAPAPEFMLTDIDGKSHKLSDFKGKTVVIEWFNPECPVVKRHYNAKTSVNTFGEFKNKDVVWLLVNSGAPGNQGAGAEKSKAGRTQWSLSFPILLDESGLVGRMYGAKTTPHIFIVDKTGVLRYAGAIDNDNQGTKAGKPEYVNYVKQALTQVLAGETVTPNSTEAYGCSVKYAG